MAVLLASALLHAVLLALLIGYSRQSLPAYDEAPALQVTLVPPFRSASARRPPVDLPPAVHSDAAASTDRALPIQAEAPSPPDGNALPSDGSSRQDNVTAGGRQVLRGLRGCDQGQLTRDEREQCEAQRWARTVPTPARLNLDPTGRFTKNPEPFLSRRPEKGCRMRLTGDVDAKGDDMNSRAGVTCVKRF